MTARRLVLASASPRRKQLLSQIGLSFRVASQNVDEAQLIAELAPDYVQRLATNKAESALRRLATASESVIIAADTVVLCDQEILGKPEDQADAVRMLLQLSAREHHVLTAVAVATRSRHKTILSDSTVIFRSINRREAEQYWHSGEPVGKAGGYAIQGHAAVFVKHLRGSYSGVMGLPLFEAAQLLRDFGIECWQPEMGQ